MRRLLILTVVLAAATGGAAAKAAAPADVHIRLHPTVFCCPQAGIWDASGAINDSGTYIRTEAHATGSIPVCPDLLEHRGAFQEEFLLTSLQGHGTLTLDDETLVAPTDPTSCFGDVVQIVWQINAGTGEYGATSAHGTGFFGPPLTLYLDGIAQVR